MNEDSQKNLINDKSSTEVFQNEAETSGGRTHRILKDEQLCQPSPTIIDTVINILTPTYLGSQKSKTVLTSFTSLEKYGDLKNVIEFLHRDEELLMAAEAGDVKTLEKLVKSGIDVNKMDHLGRNALHFAVFSGNRDAVALLLNAGLDPKVEDDVGMTPLSLCLMRRPSWKMASLLFEYGARVIPRSGPMDTGLFIQFVMMCEPTKEEERILHLLIEKGCKVDDPEAPGKRQALHFAAMNNNCQLIKILIEQGADLFSRNHRNETPMDVAATFNCKEAYTLLAELENDYLSGNRTGPTAVADKASST